MGIYWNPDDPAKIDQMTFADVQAAGGRPLYSISHDSHRQQLLSGEVVAFYGDNGEYRLVAHIYDQQEHDRFLECVIVGDFVTWQFCAMPATAFDPLPTAV